MGACCSTATVGDVVDKEASESNQSFPQINVTRPTMFAGKKSMFAKNKSGNNEEDANREVKKVSTCSILSKKDKNELEAVPSQTKKKTRKSNLSFNDCDEVRDYEKESAIGDDERLKKKSQFKRISAMDVTEEDTNVNFKKLVISVSKTFTG